MNKDVLILIDKIMILNSKYYTQLGVNLSHSKKSILKKLESIDDEDKEGYLVCLHDTLEVEYRVELEGKKKKEISSELRRQASREESVRRQC